MQTIDELEIECSEEYKGWWPKPFEYRFNPALNRQKTTASHTVLTLPESRNQFIYGPANSSKTVSIFQREVGHCIKRGWWAICNTDCQKTSKMLKNTILKLVVDDWGGWEEKRWVLDGDEGVMNYTFPSGGKFSFDSPQFAEDSKGLRPNVFINNELTRLPPGIYQEQDNRVTDYQVSDWNPNIPSVFDEIVEGLDDYIAIILPIGANEMCPPKIKKNNERMAKYDPERHAVYVKGKKGWLENQIYTHLIEIPPTRNKDGLIQHVPPGAMLMGRGLDFGYEDPTAVVALYQKAGILIIDQELYAKKLNSLQLASILRSLPSNHVPIYADYHRPDAIATLRQLRVPIYGSRWSEVVDGITLIMSKTVCYTARSIDFKKELENYVWGREKSGLPTYKPAKKQQEHAMDAMRYAITNTNNWAGDGPMVGEKKRWVLPIENMWRRH